MAADREYVNATQIYVLQRDRERLRKLAGHDTRSPKDEFTVILNEACQARGLDPGTVDPAEPQAA